MTNQCVQVKLELGHKASVRKKPTIEGFTHDWTVFVRGPEGSNIQHFVDKVIFYLHESFPKPKRAIKEPPYQVSESGYAGFLLPIEVYFKNKEEPKKVRFDYDLFLHLDGCPPVNHIRCEKLTFQNPTEDFRRKLIKAGGVPIPPNEVPTYPPPVAGSTEPQSFVDIFGTPHKTSKSSPEPSKKFKSAKDGKSGTSKGPKSTLSTTSSSSTIPSKEPKSSSSKDKEHKTSTREMKTAIKRPPSPTSIPSETSTQKTLKRSLSTSSSTSISNDSFASAQAKKDKKNKDKDKHKKEKSHKNKKQESDNRKIENETIKPHKKLTPLATTQPSVTNKAEPSSGLTGPTRSELLLLENMRSDDEMQERENQDPADTSPSSSISFSSLPVVGVGGTLGTLMAELDDQEDDDDDFISPIPSEKSLPNLYPMSIPKLPEIVKPSLSPSQPLKTVTSEKQEKKPEKKHKRTSSTSSKKSSKADKKSNSNLENNPNGQNQQINNEYIAELLDLQRRIMALKDRHHLQQIVNVIEETGLFQVTNTTFDFDLCSLDKNTVRKLQGCLQASA